jgi:serine/threonine protein kinase/tetratricopeptide (TPR) repeat protein
MELGNPDKTVQTPVALSERQLRDAIEKARAHGPSVLAGEFLPSPSDPQRLPVLLTILRADVCGHSKHPRRRLADYRSAYPVLDQDPNARVAVAAIEAVVADSADNTPSPVGTLKVHPAKRESADGAAGQAAGLELTPEVAERLGFTELVPLGKGGFGSVYLAKQPTLGHRCVAIKYTALPSRESQVLAALHHPNIVPVLSVHEYQGARVFCMPYHGRHTLADVLQQIDRTKSLPATGAGFLSTATAPPDADGLALLSPPSAPPTGQLVLPEDEPWGYYETDRQRLTRLSYVDSVVMGVTRLADALVHAHSRRVIHLDLKPANILITDDGVFMILDFGLADHNGVGPVGPTGGTIRYMAPEQLSQFVHGAVRPDVRMDLYSLGLVFFELLTGRHPYAASMAADVPMHVRVAARHQPPPPVRAFNPAVPPAVEAIVLKLLQPDRAKRYQSAEHLLVDLTRHQQNLALKYAGNPSVFERVAKFRRRHPVAAVALMALTLGLIALAAIGIAGKQVEYAAAQRAKAETAEAVVTLERLSAEQNAVRIDAGSVERRTVRAAALARVEAWRGEYAVADPAWRARPGVTRLSADQQTGLALALAEHALLAAHAERLNATGQKPEVANPALDRAVEWNRRAEAVLGGRPLPPVLVEQRAELARLRGESAPPDPREVAGETNLDHYLRGLARIADRRYEDAATELERLIKDEPHHAAGQFALGAVYQTTGRFPDAVERYQVAKALAKHDPRPAFNRGALLVVMRRHSEAVDDLTTALDRDPGMTEAYHQRATAHLQLGQYDRALADVDTAVRLGGVSYRALCLRHAIHTANQDAAAAARDVAQIATVPPVDEQDYVTRANRTINPRLAAVTDASRLAALDDYRTATELNPLCVAAWRGLAKVQSDLRRPADAIDSLDKVIQLYPGQPQPKFERAVLLARLGRRDEAVRQIAGVPTDGMTGYMWYQKACVHALGTETHITDRQEAFNALRTALHLRFNDYQLLDTDEDLANVRDLPDFHTLIRTRGRAAE